MEPQESELPPEIWSEIMSRTRTRRGLESLATVGRAFAKTKQEIQSDEWSLENPNGRYYNDIYLSDLTLHLLHELIQEKKMIYASDYQTSHLASLIYCAERYKLLGGIAVIIAAGVSYNTLVATSKLLREDEMFPTIDETGVFIIPYENDRSHLADVENLHTVVYDPLHGAIHVNLHHDTQISAIYMTDPLALLPLRNETTKLWCYVSTESSTTDDIISSCPGRVLVLIKRKLGLPSELIDGRVHTRRYFYNFVDSFADMDLFDSFVCLGDDRNSVLRLASLCMQSQKTKYLVSNYIPLPAKVIRELGAEQQSSFEITQKSLCNMSYQELYFYGGFAPKSTTIRKPEVISHGCWLILDPSAGPEGKPESRPIDTLH